MANEFDWRKVVAEDMRRNPDGSDSLLSMDELDERRRDQDDLHDVGELHLDDLLRECVDRHGSDLHLTVGLPPMVRLDGELSPLAYRRLGDIDTRRLIYDVLTADHLQAFETTHELDFSYSVKGLARFRFNVYMQRGSVAAAMRVIPARIPTYEDLRLAPILRELSKRASGLILVTGPTGSGKSTTIATMLDDINANRTCHIITIEDPIEYLHAHRSCMVNQREVGSDTQFVSNALRAVLREDPDVLLIGEMRDLETISAALTLAETGHLVFATLHTRNAPQSVDRIIDVFPPSQQEQIRVLLSNTCEAIIAQQLLPQLGGGRIVALEIMVATPAIRNMIREAKTHQMYSVIETGSEHGMQTMDRALADLHRQGYVSYEEAARRAVDKDSFSRLAKGL